MFRAHRRLRTSQTITPTGDLLTLFKEALRFLYSEAPCNSTSAAQPAAPASPLLVPERQVELNTLGRLRFMTSSHYFPYICT